LGGAGARRHVAVGLDVLDGDGEQGIVQRAGLHGAESEQYGPLVVRGEAGEGFACQW